MDIRARPSEFESKVATHPKVFDRFNERLSTRTKLPSLLLSSLLTHQETLSVTEPAKLSTTLAMNC